MNKKRANPVREKAFAIRRSNLQALVDQDFGGNASAFDATMGWTAGRTSAYLRELKNIGPLVARAIEQKFNLRTAAFDIENCFVEEQRQAAAPFDGLEIDVASAIHRHEYHSGKMLKPELFDEALRLCRNFVETAQFLQPDASKSELINVFVLSVFKRENLK